MRLVANFGRLTQLAEGGLSIAQGFSGNDHVGLPFKLKSLSRAAQLQVKHWQWFRSRGDKLDQPPFNRIVIRDHVMIFL